MEEWRSWSKEELEFQMSPSRWNPDKSADDVINQYVVICNTETEKAKQRIPHKLNVVYNTSSSSKPSQKYDIYGTDLPENEKIFFWIHGGYWQECSKDISAPMAENLYSVGVKTVVFGYTLAPNASIFQIQEEFLLALKHVAETYQNAKIVVGGHSAGGHLTATLLHRRTDFEIRDKIAGLAFYSGVFDLRPLVTTYINDALKMTSTDAEKLSPLLLPLEPDVINTDIPILLTIGALEFGEFQRQTKDYAIKLRKVYSCVQVLPSENDDHFTIIENLPKISKSSSGEALLNFIKLVKAKY